MVCEEQVMMVYIIYLKEIVLVRLNSAYLLNSHFIFDVGNFMVDYLCFEMRFFSNGDLLYTVGISYVL